MIFFSNVKYFYQYSKKKMLSLYEHSYHIIFKFYFSFREFDNLSYIFNSFSAPVQKLLRNLKYELNKLPSLYQKHSLFNNRTIISTKNMFSDIHN